MQNGTLNNFVCQVGTLEPWRICDLLMGHFCLALESFLSGNIRPVKSNFVIFFQKKPEIL